MQARASLESGRTADIEGILAAAEKFLDGEPDADKAPVVADIVAIRAELANTMKPEDRRALAAAQGKLRQARAAVDDDNLFGLEDTLGAAEKFLATISVPPNAEMTAATAEIAALRARGRGLKPGAAVATAPAAAAAATGGAPAVAPIAPVSAHVVEPVSLPPEHATAVVEASATPTPPVTWDFATMRVPVSNQWREIEQSIAGWEHEAIGLDATPLEDPGLPKTREALVRIGYLMRDPATRAHRADPAFEATYRIAEQTFDTCAAQLHAAYASLLAEAEAMPTPMQRALRDRPNQLACAASLSLHGTKFREDIVARAVKLDTRWDAEISVIMQAHHALHDTRVRDADAAWPLIMARTDVQPELDPTRLAARGKTVLLAGAINRSGWELGGHGYDFALRGGSVPLAGVFSPRVRDALVQAWTEDRLDVSDRIPWDVIAIVDGPDTIGQRTLITLEDNETRLEIGVLEEWRKIPCIRLEIIALHAGPVAIGP